MKLIPDDIIEKISVSKEKLKNPIVYIKYFTPDDFKAWYVISYESDKELFYGYIDSLKPKLGKFSLEELEEKKGPLGKSIERDICFKPTRLNEIMRRIKNRDKSDTKNTVAIKLNKENINKVLEKVDYNQIFYDAPLGLIEKEGISVDHRVDVTNVGYSYDEGLNVRATIQYLNITGHYGIVDYIKDNIEKIKNKKIGINLDDKYYILRITSFFNLEHQKEKVKNHDIVSAEFDLYMREVFNREKVVKQEKKVNDSDKSKFRNKKKLEFVKVGKAKKDNPEEISAQIIHSGQDFEFQLKKNHLKKDINDPDYHLISDINKLKEHCIKYKNIVDDTHAVFGNAWLKKMKNKDSYIAMQFNIQKIYFYMNILPDNNKTDKTDCIISMPLKTAKKFSIRVLSERNKINESSKSFTM